MNMAKEIRSAAEIKKQNVASIKRVILEMGSVTKPEVAEKTGLSVVTCGSILNEMTAEGSIVEERLRSSSGGRRAMSYRISEGVGNTLCLYAFTESTGSFIRYQVRDLIGNVKDAGFTQEPVINVTTLSEAIKRICKPEQNVKIVVLGIQGCINNNILEYSDLTELSGLNVAAELENATGFPVRVENDMNTIAVGYRKNCEKKLDSKSGRNVAILFFPKGQTPAGGFIVDGNILRGASNLAGELSFFPYNFKKEDQRVVFSSIEKAQPTINRMILATTVFLDPAVVVITGGLSREVDCDAMTKYLQDNLKRPQIPRIEAHPVIERDYFTGLHCIAVDYIIDG